MRISKLPRQNLLRVPSNFAKSKTSDLIEKCSIVSFKELGLPYYPPIGNLILEKIRKLTSEAHLKEGVLMFRIPSYMRRDLLDEGEEISETFEKKFAMLPKPMEKYMVLTTHEIEVLDWLKRDNISYKNLPLRLFFNKEILRPISDPKGILKLREFETQIMLTLDQNEEEFKQSLKAYANICESIFKNLKLPVKKCVKEVKNKRGGHLDFDLEYFYQCSEGENICTNIDETRERALSLAAGYRYNPQPGVITYVSLDNQLVPPVVGTYVIGLERLLYAMFDSSRDKMGFNLPDSIRPFDFSILTFDSYPDTIENAEKIYQSINLNGKKVLYDDRIRCKRVEKAKYSDLLGIPTKIILSKGTIRRKERNNSSLEINYKNINEFSNHVLAD